MSFASRLLRWTLVTSILALGVAGCESAAERAALEKAKVREVDGAVPAGAPSEDAARSQAIPVEPHDRKMDPRITVGPAKGSAEGSGGSTSAMEGAEAGSGSAMDGASAPSGDAAGAAEAGSGSANCTCSKDKPSCGCGHCSGAIGVCHCRHGK